jgi:hypothetical protein
MNSSSETGATVALPLQFFQRIVGSMVNSTHPRTAAARPDWPLLCGCGIRHLPAVRGVQLDPRVPEGAAQVRVRHDVRRVRHCASDVAGAQGHPDSVVISTARVTW